MATTESTDDATELSETRIHEVLSNDRRRLVIELLQENGSMTLRELSERIAEIETGESPPPRNIRQSAYVSLQQTHVPKLDRFDIIDFDDDDKSVELHQGAGDVAVYMEVVPEGEISWAEYYAALGALGLLLVVAVAVGVPFLSTVGPGLVAGAVFFIVCCSGLYQRWSQQQG